MGKNKKKKPETMTVKYDEVRHVENVPLAIFNDPNDCVDATTYAGRRMMSAVREMKKRELLQHVKLAQYMSKQTSKLVYRTLESDKPEECVSLDVDTIIELGKLWGVEDFVRKLDMDIPTDLLWSGTLPVLDIQNDTVMRGLDPKAAIKSCRIKIYPDYHERLMKAGPGQTIEVGICNIKYKTESFEFATFMYVNTDDPDAMYYSDIYAYRGKMHSGHYLTQEAAEGLIHQYCGMWYGIMIAELFPPLKEAFVDETPEKRTVSNHEEYKEKPLKNVRYRRIDIHTMKRVIYGGGNHGTNSGKTYSRHKPYWRCKGYHRANGKFVKAHWRGPLRNTKVKNVTREREI